MINLPNDIEELTKLVINVMGREDYEYAKEILLKLIEIDKANIINYLVNLGNCYSWTNEKKKALISYKKARDIYYKATGKYPAPQKDEILSRIIKDSLALLTEEKEFKKRIRSFDRRIKIDSNDVTSLVLRGFCKDSLYSYEYSIDGESRFSHLTSACLDYDKAINLGLPEEIEKWARETIVSLADMFVRPPQDSTLILDKSVKLLATKDEVKNYRNNMDKTWSNFVEKTKFIISLPDKAPEEIRSEAAKLCTLTLEFFHFVHKSRKKNIQWQIGESGSINLLTRNDIYRTTLLSDQNIHFDNHLCKVIDDSGEERYVSLNLGNRIANKVKLKSLSKARELLRKQKYYYKNREKLLEYQKAYDKKHKVEKKVRNRFYYSINNNAMTRGNNYEYSDKDNIVYSQSEYPRKRKKSTKK